MKNLFSVCLVICITTIGFAQYGYRDGNRIGISGGLSQSTLYASNFASKPGIGYGGGLSVRGNYYNNWSMVYGMQFFINTFSLESTKALQNKDTEFSLSGFQQRLLLSYNIVKDHVSVDFGPVLQINGKMTVKSDDEKNILKGTLLQANQIVDVGNINGNFYLGFSAGSKVVRGIIFYQYGFTNIFGKLNSDDALLILNGNQKFKGNLGTLGVQIIFNL
ncbi:MAG: PorT family protein [Flavobacterium sp.]|nr:PorT family protein [Flavobacterium sp.]